MVMGVTSVFMLEFGNTLVTSGHRRAMLVVMVTSISCRRVGIRMLNCVTTVVENRSAEVEIGMQ